jgi:hypothetical protein
MNLTRDQLKGITTIIAERVPHLGHAEAVVTDVDVATVNQELMARGVQGFAVEVTETVTIDIDDHTSTTPGLAQRLIDIDQSLSAVAGELGQLRMDIGNGITSLEGVLRDIQHAIDSANSFTSLSGIRDAIRALADAKILAQPLPPEDDRIGAAADRIIEALERRPDIREAVASKLQEGS